MGAVTPFGMYVRLFADASGFDYHTFRSRFYSMQVKNFMVRISNWKSTSGWTNDDIIALIYFCYMHNPMLTPDLREYGNLTNIGRCVRFFQQWRNVHEAEIESVGLIKAIYDTTQDLTYQGLEHAMTLDEVYAVYGKH